MKIFFFWLIHPDTAVVRSSCTKLLSWYSSTRTSSYFAESSLAAWDIWISSPSFVISICRAKCSISVKSRIFFSLFASPNRSLNPAVSSTNISTGPLIYLITSRSSFSVLWKYRCPSSFRIPFSSSRRSFTLCFFCSSTSAAFFVLSRANEGFISISAVPL